MIYGYLTLTYETDFVNLDEAQKSKFNIKQTLVTGEDLEEMFNFDGFLNKLQGRNLDQFDTIEELKEHLKDEFKYLKNEYKNGF